MLANGDKLDDTTFVPLFAEGVVDVAVVLALDDVLALEALGQKDELALEALGQDEDAVDEKGTVVAEDSSFVTVVLDEEVGIELERVLDSSRIILQTEKKENIRKKYKMNKKIY